MRTFGFKYYDYIYTIICCLIFFLLDCSNLLGGDIDLQEALTEVCNYRIENGHAPNDEVFFKIISEKKSSLSPVEQNEVWREIVRQQKSRFELTDIINIFRAKTNSIRDYESKFTVTKNGVSSNQKRIIHALKGTNFFLEIDNYDKNRLEKRTLAYDGQLLYTVIDDHNSPFASIQNLGVSAISFENNNPLAQSMLYDTNQTGMPHSGFDLLHFLSIFPNVVVLEKEEEFFGRRCLVIAGLSRRIYLDIESDLSVAKFQEFTVSSQNNPKGGRLLDGKRTLLSQRELFDLRDYTNGIWLPQKSVYTFYDSTGAVDSQTVITYESIRLNHGLADSYFNDIFPDGIPVADSINGLIYNSSDRPSINGLLKDITKSKRVIVLRYISVCIGLMLIVIALVMKYRVYLANKNST